MSIIAPLKEKYFLQATSDCMLIGKLEGKLETVKKMLSSGVEIASIAKSTDLSLEQIESIKNY